MRGTGVSEHASKACVSGEVSAQARTVGERRRPQDAALVTARHFRTSCLPIAASYRLRPVRQPRVPRSVCPRDPPMR